MFSGHDGHEHDRMLIEGDDDHIQGKEVILKEQPTYVILLTSLLVSASVWLLMFLSTGMGSMSLVFDWLVSVALLQSWVGMLYTYIRCVCSSHLSFLPAPAGAHSHGAHRWHQGTVCYENNYKGKDLDESKTVCEQIARIKVHQQWGQLYVQAVSICLQLCSTWA